MFLLLLLIITISVILFIILRVLYVIRRSLHLSNKKCKSIKTFIILGSGGHTAEMIAVLRKLNKTVYTPRTYILAESDHTSLSKVVEVENNRTSSPAEESKIETRAENTEFEIIKIARSRRVGQSYISSIWTTLWSIVQCVPLVYRAKPNLILCNGPGTCVPICLIAFLFKIFFINSNCRMVFVESVCRTKTLSLSGKLLLWIVDLFIVQWPQLTEKSSRIKYFGRLM